MNILVVGRGGREYSIVKKLTEAETEHHVYAAPGNGGMAKLAAIVPIDEMDISSLAEFAKEKAIDLTIVGPENPLNAGIANHFQEKGLPIFAPAKEAALLEGSKQFAKEFMQKYHIPTAGYASFTDAADAKKYIMKKAAPIVIKADGLAAGKGVVVARSVEEALQAVDDMLVNKTFAEAGARIVIEEFLEGLEFSLMAFVHEGNVFPMLPARDHKRAYDNDEGPNTGGMGAYAPVPDITNDIFAYAEQEILQKAADGLVAEGRPFTGVLYAGLMMTNNGPQVIEFNTRFGDPETQVVLPLLENDLVDVLLKVMQGENPALTWKTDYCAGVVVAAAGYPGTYAKGIELPEMHDSETVFYAHAGTKQASEKLVSSGGRVLLAGSTDKTLENALDNVYQALAACGPLDGFFYRKDIGKTSIKH